jgi:hypothetical protein
VYEVALHPSTPPRPTSKRPTTNVFPIIAFLMRPELENTALRLEAQLVFQPDSLRKLFVIRYLHNSRGGLEHVEVKYVANPTNGKELLASISRDLSNTAL